MIIYLAHWGGKNLIMRIWDNNSPFFNGTSTTAESWWNLYWSSNGNDSPLVERGCVWQGRHHGRVPCILPSQLSGANHDISCPSLWDALRAPCVLSPHGPSPAKIPAPRHRLLEQALLFSHMCRNIRLVLCHACCVIWRALMDLKAHVVLRHQF